MSDIGTPTPDQQAHDAGHQHGHDHHGHGGEYPSTATDVAAVWDERYATEAWPTDPTP